MIARGIGFEPAGRRQMIDHLQVFTVGDRKDDADRIRLDDGGERAAGRGNKIADSDLGFADATRNRCDDLGVGEVQLRRLDLCLGLGDLSLGLLDLRIGRITGGRCLIDGFLGDSPGCEQCSLTRKCQFCLFQVGDSTGLGGIGARERGVGAVEGCLVGVLFYFEERGSRLDVASFNKVDRREKPFNARHDGHLLDRRHGADERSIAGDGSKLHRRCFDRRRWHVGCVLRRGCGYNEAEK